MIRNIFKPLRAFGSWAVMAWLSALVVFLLWLGWVFFSIDTPKANNAAENPVNLPEEITAAVVLDLPAMDTPSPDLPFDPEQVYTLVGAAIQGFYQNSWPDDVWTFSYPSPQLTAQIIRRGPPTPQRVTRNIDVTWELLNPASLSDPAAAAKGQMDVVEDSHFEVSIPLSPSGVDDLLDPYPVVLLRAEDRNTGRLLAQSAAVLPMAPGFGCAHCHENAGVAILEVHDRHESTTLQQEYAQGTVIACRDCHGGSTAVPDNSTERRLSLSAAIHGWHAPYLAGRAEDACMTCHITLGRLDGSSSPDDAPQPLFARSFHVDRGLNCIRCHGYMEDHALALLKAEQEAGIAMADLVMGSISARAIALEDIQPRLPWVQEPDCTSCHDFSQKPNLMNATGFNKWTGTPGRASTLFSARKDNMAMVRCLTCHGAPHAVYPATNPVSANLDNMPPLQYQEQAATLGDYGNCAVCHGESRETSAHHPLVKWSETIVHPPQGAELMMPPARFPHAAHVSWITCTTCHHMGYEDGTSLLCTSSGCHDGIEDTGTEGKIDYRYFYNAFHGDFPSCLACHTESLAAGKPAGPTDCQACHQAPSPRWESVP